MKAVVKAGVFLGLVAGLTLWVAVAVSQQGAWGASNQAPVDQGGQSAEREDHLSLRADGRIDNADLAVLSAPALAPTPTYTVSLPTVLSAHCVPSEPGESDNIVDALTICSGKTVYGQVNDYDWDDVYKILTVANQELFIVLTGTGVGGPGDADLYLYPPGTTDINTDPWSDRSTNYGNNELIWYTVPVGGYWYVDVFDFADDDGGTNYDLTVTVSGPAATGGGTDDLPEGGQLRQRNRWKGAD